MSQQMQECTTGGVVDRLVERWRDWARRRRTVADLDCCGPSELERLGRDMGVGRQEICTLAGKWPGSADLLLQRMKGVKLNVADVARLEPQVLRDLERVCTLCGSKRRCQHDLASDPSGRGWREYCPNVMTLDALAAERTTRGNGSPD